MKLTEGLDAVHERGGVIRLTVEYEPSVHKTVLLDRKQQRELLRHLLNSACVFPAKGTR